MGCLTTDEIAALEAEKADLEILIPAMVAGMAGAAASGIQSFTLDTGIAKQSTKNFNIIESATTLRQWRSRLDWINRMLTGTGLKTTSLKRFG